MEYDATISHCPQGWANDRLHFFKYMSADTAKIVLKNRTLRWSCPSLLNDPFDIQFNMEIQADPVRMKAMALERLWDVFEGRATPHPQNPLGALFSMLAAAQLPISKKELLTKIGPAYDEEYAKMLAMLPSVHAEAAAIKNGLDSIDAPTLLRISSFEHAEVMNPIGGSGRFDLDNNAGHWSVCLGVAA